MTTNKDLKEQIVTVGISQGDIDNAKGKCPIWTWFEQAFPQFKVKVLRSSVQILPQTGNKGLYGKFPYEAITFTHAFDFGLKCNPVCFNVDLRI